MQSEDEKRSSLNAAEHIKKAMSSRQAYDEMAAKEASIWSKQLVEPNRRELQALEQDAAIKLRLNDKVFAIGRWAREKGLKFKRGLSVGCGAGRAERHFIDLGLCESFHGVDIAADAVASAAKEASARNYACTYEVGDINFMDFGEERFDFVLAQTSLHHIVHLENVFAAISRAMLPDGYFYLSDFVGESQFQWSDLKISICNRILAELPAEFRKSRSNGEIVEKLFRREPGKLVSPFESIRSGEILTIAKQFFSVTAGTVSSSIIDLVCPFGARANYLKNDESIALFRVIKLLDEILIETGVLQGSRAELILRKLAV